MHRYLLALGSNMRHPRLGMPHQLIAEAIAALAQNDVDVIAQSAVMRTEPLGPSARRYSNSCIVAESERDPPRMLALVNVIETGLGRRRRGRRWSARTIDIDIVLWSGGIWVDERLAIPHPSFRDRGFVLGPATEVAPDWRDPISGLSVAHLFARLTKPRPVPR